MGGCITYPWAWLADGNNPLSFLGYDNLPVPYGLYFLFLILNAIVIYYLGWGAGKVFSMMFG
ncbi:MAG TPA: hypothetical protein VMT81_02440 [Candidatus Paceibacterota bacterium]|nr:hypothetical protein [Candidatus Paceibacterota bacterium]